MLVRICQSFRSVPIISVGTGKAILISNTFVGDRNRRLKRLRNNPGAAVNSVGPRFQRQNNPDPSGSIGRKASLLV